jgi:hypothetical protein
LNATYGTIPSELSLLAYQVVAAQKREANKQAKRTIYFAIREDIAKVEAQKPYT